MSALTRRGAVIAALAALGLLAGGCAGGSANNESSSSSAPSEVSDGAAAEVSTEATTPASEEPADPATQAKAFKIGVTQIVSHPSLDLIVQGFKDALVAAGLEVTYDEQNAQGDMANAATIANLFADDASMDLILAVATPTAQAVVTSISDKPILFAGITDPVAANLVPSLAASGTNVSGTSDINPEAHPVELIHSILPDAKKIGVLYSSSETNSVVQVEAYEAEAATLGIEVVRATVTNASEVAAGAASLSDVDAILIPTDNTVVSALEVVIDFAETNQVPLFSADAESVVLGTIATRGLSYYDLGLHTGEMAVQILRDGVDVGTIPTLVVTETELKVNPKAAELMGVTLPDELLANATIVED